MWFLTITDIAVIWSTSSSEYAYARRRSL